MKKFIEPEIEILLFDDEEITAEASNTANYAAKQLNEYMFNDKQVNSTTTVKIENIQVIGE